MISDFTIQAFLRTTFWRWNTELKNPLWIKKKKENFLPSELRSKKKKFPLNYEKKKTFFKFPQFFRNQ